MASYQLPAILVSAMTQSANKQKIKFKAQMALSRTVVGKGTYAGSDLKMINVRAEGLEYQKIPSKIGNQYVYLDGTVEAIDHA